VTAFVLFDHFGYSSFIPSVMYGISKSCEFAPALEQRQQTIQLSRYPAWESTAAKRQKRLSYSTKYGKGQSKARPKLTLLWP